jgi:hypothetical protein
VARVLAISNRESNFVCKGHVIVYLRWNRATVAISKLNPSAIRASNKVTLVGYRVMTVNPLTRGHAEAIA